MGRQIRKTSSSSKTTKDDSLDFDVWLSAVKAATAPPPIPEEWLTMADVAEKLGYVSTRSKHYLKKIQTATELGYIKQHMVGSKKYLELLFPEGGTS